MLAGKGLACFLTTIMVAPLMTCSARIPVYTLIIAAFIPNRTVWGFANMQGLVMFGLYAAGILSALAVSFVIEVTEPDELRGRLARVADRLGAAVPDPALGPPTLPASMLIS